MKTARWAWLVVVVIVFGFVSAQAQTSGLPPLNQDPAAANMNDHDWQFVKQAAQDEMTQIQLGELAAQKAESPAVRHLGQDLASIHSMRLNQLKNLAIQKAMTLPNQPSQTQRELIQKLKDMSSGPQFDPAWISATISNHEQELEGFRSEIRRGQDPSVTAFARNAMDILPGELRRAQDLSQSMEAKK